MLKFLPLPLFLKHLLFYMEIIFRFPTNIPFNKVFCNNKRREKEIGSFDFSTVDKDVLDFVFSLDRFFSTNLLSAKQILQSNDILSLFSRAWLTACKLTFITSALHVQCYTHTHTHAHLNSAVALKLVLIHNYKFTFPTNNEFIVAHYNLFIKKKRSHYRLSM